MTNTDTHDFEKTLVQVSSLVSAGCDIVRLAVPTEKSASVFSYLKSHGVSIPLVADIHFDYNIAIAAIRKGADKIRIIPEISEQNGKSAKLQMHVKVKDCL